ncbi:hypothetical protein [Sphingobium cloacae]|uniref:Uncharacterized protein n=1 Tax=Sphingobium cloacae TaxID=120107 RepID=A0A1E1EYC6_9SPHN|nr:hypothetical protein [Sphingobium cloacae]BAV63263.1 hypothetical protein SCLO_1002230 [Sphingobium cloacae]
MIASPDDRDLLSLLAERRDVFEARMAQFLSDTPSSSPIPDNKVAARLLLDVVLASHADVGFTAGAAAISSRKVFSHFGDALVPLLKDVLGPDVPIAFLARCVDGYWRSVREQMPKT